MFHAILFVSGKNFNTKGQLIDGGLSGITMYTTQGIINDRETQMLMAKLIDVPLEEVTIKSQTEVTSDYFCDDEYNDPNPKTSRYTRERTIKAAIVHEKDLVHFKGVPYFSLAALNEGRRLKTIRDEEIEKKGNYAFFHIGGPHVVSENNIKDFFQMNTNELDLLSIVIYKVLYAYEDSFPNKQSYRESLMV